MIIWKIRGDNVNKEKDDDIVPIQFKVKRKLRKSFRDKCRKKGYNPSGWLRVQIDKFIKVDEK
jgi:hypothetical protein